jgi:hypothetical protein
MQTIHLSLIAAGVTMLVGCTSTPPPLVAADDSGTFFGSAYRYRITKGPTVRLVRWPVPTGSAVDIYALRPGYRASGYEDGYWDSSYPHAYRTVRTVAIANRQLEADAYRQGQRDYFFGRSPNYRRYHCTYSRAGEFEYRRTYEMGYTDRLRR